MDKKELLKLTLLSHSANMRNAAEAAEWTTLQELFHNWDETIAGAREELGKEFEAISGQLIEDNVAITKYLEQSQKNLVAEFHQSRQNTKSLKKYLK